MKPDLPEIDISGSDLAGSASAAVEIKHSLAKHLTGRVFTVHYANGTHQYTVTQKSGADWHEFSLKEEDVLCEEETSAPGKASAD